jgi:hypothetical protein
VKKLLMAAFLLLGVAAMSMAAEETQATRVSVFLATTTTPSSLAISSNTGGTLYGWTCSTGAVTNYLILRDTNTINTTSGELLPKYGLSTSVPQTVTLTNPIRVTNGLQANMGATTADAECAVFIKSGKL